MSAVVSRTIWITLGLLAASSALHGVAGARYRDIVGFITDPLLTAALIVQSMAFQGTTARWLNWSWIRYLGRISYSLYLYQQIIVAPVRALFAGYPRLVQLLAASLAVIAAASLSYYVVERPFLRLKTRWGSRRSGQAAAQAVRF